MRSTDRAIYLGPGWPGSQPTVPNCHFFYRWLVDRVVDRQAILGLFWTPTASFSRPYKYGSLRAVFIKIFNNKFFHFLKCFLQVLKTSYSAKNLYLYFVSKILKNQKKISFGIIFLVQNFYILSRVFFKCFLFQNTLFSHTWAINSIPIYMILFFVRKIVCDLSSSPRESLWSLGH